MKRLGRTDSTSSRRGCLKYGAAVIGGGLCAGCADDAASDGAAGDRSTPGSATAGADAYDVQLPPVGTVGFDAVPEQWIAYQYAYGDMGVALGQGDGYLGTNKPSNYPDFFYQELPGVEFDAATLTDIGSGDKEIFYQLAPDVLFIDPNNAQSRFEWTESDVDDIATTVAPFFGHFGRRYGYEYQTEYPQLGLYDLFAAVADVFQQRERYREIKAIHDSVLETLRADIPPAADRPTVALLSGGSNVSKGTLYLMEATAPGYGRKQYRDLGVHDAMDSVDTTEQFFQTDFEELLELDPDVLVVHWTIQLSDSEFDTQFLEPLEDHPVGSELTAVQNGRVYKGGTAEQGPIINLFQTEVAIEQLYPDIASGGDLFSRDELAQIVTGGAAA
jgi:iron complex transport system substrate-binding protein